MANVSEQIDDLHIRIGQLETRLSEETEIREPVHPGIGLVVSVIALLFAYFGFDSPNHLYQFVFATIFVLVLYNKRTIATPSNWYQWVFVVTNLLTSAMILKLLIGGGEPKPFYWAQVPFSALSQNA